MAGSLPRAIALGVALLTAASARAAAPEGCFERVYSLRHLREHPGQVVRRLVVILGWDDEAKQNTFGVKARLRGKPQIWRAGGPCASLGEGWRCRPDTDGDPDVFAGLEGGALRFSNPKRLKVVDDETGPGLNEAVVEGPANRGFLLFRTSAARCAGR